jgi:hypothetical protein
MMKTVTPSQSTDSTRNHRSAPPIPIGLGGGEAMSDHREQSINFSLLLNVLFENRDGRSTTTRGN